MKNLKNISEDLFNKIRGKFPSITIGDEKGNITNDPAEARFFDFDFKDGTSTIGTVSISVDENNLSIMYLNNFLKNQDQITKRQWYDFLRELRVFSKKRLLNFDIRNITKSNLDKRDYKFLAQVGDQQMTESKMYGTSKISYQDIGNARISIKHHKPINPELVTGRTQYIENIFIENGEGERFKYPFKHLGGARAMARHIAEGGSMHDDFGNYVVKLSEEMYKLRKFKNYMNRSSVMAEGLAEYLHIVNDRIETVKKTIENIQKEKHYKQIIETFVLEDDVEVPDDIAENWIDQLTIKQFNEELKDVFPYIYKLVNEKTKPVEVGPEEFTEEEDSEEEVKEIEEQSFSEFESWADDLIANTIKF